MLPPLNVHRVIDSIQPLVKAASETLQPEVKLPDELEQPRIRLFEDDLVRDRKR